MAFWKRKDKAAPGGDGKPSGSSAAPAVEAQVGDPLQGLAPETVVAPVKPLAKAAPAPPKPASAPPAGAPRAAVPTAPKPAPAPQAPSAPKAVAPPKAAAPVAPKPPAAAAPKPAAPVAQKAAVAPAAPSAAAPKADAPKPAGPPKSGTSVRTDGSGRVVVDDSTAAARFKGEGVERMVNELEAAGLFGKDQLQEVYKRASEAESAQALRKELAVTGLANEEDMIEAIAASIGMERVSLLDFKAPPEALADVPQKIARQYHVFPLASTPDTLTIAVSDPLDIRISDELQLKLGKTIVSKLAADVEIDQAIRRHYDKDNIGSIIQSTIESEEKRLAKEAVESDEPEEDETLRGVIDLDRVRDQGEPAVVQFVNLLFKEAVHQRASDIHIEPTKFSTTVRLRVDGILRELPSPPKKWERMILSRLKVMSGMDLAEKRIPQDGRIQLNVQGRALDLRVSCLPAIFGESIVMRILDQSSIMLGLEDVGFLEDNIKKFAQLIRSPNGVILMTGPTGSGKTTTLYAALNTLNNPEMKLVTIEDPVEYQVQGINQIQVNQDVGLDFAAGLRSVLRQSPDIIMVGEIRDAETAEAATRAALTGHLVFSTLHTNDAPSATVRLIDIGIAPFLVASSIQAVIAQRLIRRVCSHCVTKYIAKAEEIASTGVDPEPFLGREFVVGRGCDRCSNSGYRGRTAIHEIFEMNPELRQMVIRREPATRLKAVGVRHGMRTLRMDGWEKILRDQTTIEEVMRITALD